MNRRGDKTVRAAVCIKHGGPLVIEEVEVAAPGPGQVRVDIEVCAICHSDITYIDGGWGGPTPAIYGHEAAGTIESVGDGVSFEPGQQVIVGLLRSCGDCYHCVRGEENLCVGEFDESSPFVRTDGTPVEIGLRTGAFSSQTVVHESQVVAVPEGVGLEAASLLACGVLTGFGAVTNTASMPPGATAAVIGLGGVGLSAIQGAHLQEASVLIGVDIVDEKLQIAEDFGATVLINSLEVDPVETARSATAGVGPDFVFVTVGIRLAIDQALAMVRTGGTVVFVGMPPSGLATEIEVTNLADASQRLLGSKMGSAVLSRDVPRLIELYQAGVLDLDRMVSNVYAVEEINEAIAEVRTGQVIRNLIRFT